MRKSLDAKIIALTHAVRRAGGVVLTREMQRAGFSAHTIASAVASGALLRLRRRWLAVPDADADLAAAARAGVLLSCTTAAARLDLWVLDPGGVHVAAPARAGRVDVAEGTRVHRAAPLVARAPGLLIDPVENVLALVAACLPFEQALAVWGSAMNTGLVTRSEMLRLPLRGVSREIAELAEPLADSGLESLVIVRLRWLGERIIAQAWILGHRVDFLIGERLVLQIDGGHHVDAQREADVRHDALLLLNGYHVIRVGYRQVVDDWPSVQHDITRAIAQGLHRAQ